LNRASAPFSIADIQYANIDDGFNFGRTVQRHYRGSLAMLDAAVGFWSERKVGLVCQMGDIIDGQAKTHSDSEKDLQAVMAKLNRIQPEVGWVVVFIWHSLFVAPR
jgi:manganese-dependent ADP-ribose/CDP-alcohol diphosphatase